MPKRPRPKIEKEEQSFFAGPNTNLQYVSSGCTLLDCALSGGYPLGRITNIVGDKSTAKTSLATEALINFKRSYTEGVAAYRDAESAFDQHYAAAMGLPIDDIDFGEPFNTVESFAIDSEKYLASRAKDQRPGIYVLDSLDSLSDETEMSQDVGEATYGMSKAKNLSIYFRKNIGRVEQSKVNLFIVSQVRENINVRFGEKYRRAGGKALDFYASQIIWLAHIKQLERTIKGVERSYGVTVKAKVKKNKVGMPFRECNFDFIFGFGIDDLASSVKWLIEVKRTEAIKMSDLAAKAYVKNIVDMNTEEYRAENEAVAPVVKELWAEIETSFLPKRSKYG